jgi:hypothetical protein
LLLCWHWQDWHAAAVVVLGLRSCRVLELKKEL